MEKARHLKQSTRETFNYDLNDIQSQPRRDVIVYRRVSEQAFRQDLEASEKLYREREERKDLWDTILANDPTLLPRTDHTKPSERASSTTLYTQWALINNRDHCVDGCAGFVAPSARCKHHWRRENILVCPSCSALFVVTESGNGETPYCYAHCSIQ
jgi:hypothetical protein